MIDDGPFWFARDGIDYTYGFRLDGASNGTKISHLTFDNVAFPVFARGSNDVTVSHNKFKNAIQAVSNWFGSGWKIDHNKIEDLRTLNGGGIGIFIGDRTGQTAEDSRVEHNKVKGTLHVWEHDGGGYSGTGIVLFADFRWGQPGTTSISGNRVKRNKVELASDTPTVVGVVGFELTDTRNDAAFAVICDNGVEKNDFRKTLNSIAITPPELELCNKFSKNKANMLRGRTGQRSRAFGLESLRSRHVRTAAAGDPPQQLPGEVFTAATGLEDVAREHSLQPDDVRALPELVLEGPDFTRDPDP